VSVPSFADLFSRYRAVPIRGCPGRYVLRSAVAMGVEALVGASMVVVRHSVPRARDPVMVAQLADGGIISYARPDGTFVHTLCDADGFRRKLVQLGIWHPESSARASSG
jgi:hypothetical protein